MREEEQDAPGRTRVSMALVMPPPRTMSTLAFSMIVSVAGSSPVVSMSMTRINLCASWLGGCRDLGDVPG